MDKTDKKTKTAEPKWGTPEWVHAHLWSGMDKKRRARVMATGAIDEDTKKAMDLLDGVINARVALAVGAKGIVEQGCLAEAPLLKEALATIAGAERLVASAIDNRVALALFEHWCPEDEDKCECGKEGDMKKCSGKACAGKPPAKAAAKKAGKK